VERAQQEREPDARFGLCAAALGERLFTFGGSTAEKELDVLHEATLD
jgi:hypothetical protein